LIHLIAEPELTIVALQSEFLVNTIRGQRIIRFARDRENAILNAYIHFILTDSRKIRNHSKGIFCFKNPKPVTEDVLVKSGLRRDKVVVLGSARFCAEWISQNRKILPRVMKSERKRDDETQSGFS
jgi:hypothetical protein